MYVWHAHLETMKYSGSEILHKKLLKISVIFFAGNLKVISTSPS